jgi:uncharacterized protein
MVRMVMAQLDLTDATRDARDDQLMAAAVAGSVDYLVSGDEALLEPESYEGVDVIWPRTALSR